MRFKPGDRDIWAQQDLAPAAVQQAHVFDGPAAVEEIDAALDIAKEIEYLNNYDLTNLGESMIKCFKLLSGLIESKASH